MSKKSIFDLPGPRQWPILGNLHEIRPQEIHLKFDQWAKEFGSMYRIGLAGKPAIIIRDAALIATILKDRPHGFRRANRLQTILKEVGGHGVFSAEGAEWKKQRSLIARGFGVGQIKAFYPTLLSLVNRLQERLQRANENPFGVDVQKEFMRFTVDVTANLAFGYDPKTLIDDQDLLQKHLEKIFPMIGRRVQFPFSYWKYFKLPRDRELDRAIGEVKNVIFRLIESTRQKLKSAGPRPPQNVLETLILANDEEQGSLQDEELLGNIITLMLAGEDTTANSLAWTIYYLSKHPDVFSKIREESIRITGKHAPTLEQLDQLRWTNAAAQESMRLKPVAPFMFMENIEACELGGYQIPQGTLIAVLMISNYRDAQYFSKPDEFRPERWIPEHQKDFVHQEHVFMPFGLGPRFCPGATLAMTEMKAVLCMIAKNFQLEKIAGNEPKEVFNFTVMPEGLLTRFHPLIDKPERAEHNPVARVGGA